MNLKRRLWAINHIDNAQLFGGSSLDLKKRVRERKKGERPFQGLIFHECKARGDVFIGNTKAGAQHLVVWPETASRGKKKKR